jgi:hypothetical protein
VDTTALKANVHFPVDWILLRDATRTLMKAVTLTTRHPSLPFAQRRLHRGGGERP